MPKILNTTEKPYNVSIARKNNNGVLMNHPIMIIPGQSNAHPVSDEDLAVLKKQKGFKRYLDQGVLVIVEGGSSAKKDDEVKVSKTAKELAEANDIDLSTLTPNDKNAITVKMVEDAVAAKTDEDEDGGTDEDSDL